MGELLRTNPGAAKFHTLFGVKAVPHGDTLGKLAARLDPAEFQECVCALVERIIRQKVLYAHRLLGRWFVLAVDGTGMLTFARRHCPHCLTAVHNGKTVYYHHVLEAKLVTANGFAFSIMTEFIENPGPDAAKQDCELKAFYRLAARLKDRFTRLPIALAMDGLYAGGQTFKIAADFGWKFMITLKDDDLPTVNAEFEALARLQTDNQTQLRRADINTTQEYRWVNELAYQDSENRVHQLDILELRQTIDRGPRGVFTTKFKWVTNLNLKSQNVASIANQGGRIRWKIENEGFNVQKNGGFGLEHAYALKPNAAKNFYFLLQIAHILFQLLWRGNLLKKSCPNVASEKNLAYLILEAWRNAPFSPEDLERLRTKKFQARLDSS
jgi:hypothetical protein